jgi:uncharacterized protein YbjT (DUF2867 family)
MSMKVVVVGGTGLIGSKIIELIRAHGHPGRGDAERGVFDANDEADLRFWPNGVCSDWIGVVAAAPNTGVNTVTGEGLEDALKGVSVAIDVTNAPSWEDNAVMEFFQTSTRNLLACEAAAGVGHHVALSVVGSERLVESGYFRAKIAQEELIKSSSIPYSIVRATQFFEFIKAIADVSTEGNTVRLPSALIQPMAAVDVASAVCRVALGSPVNGTIEIGGPEQFRLDELVRRRLAAFGDGRDVISDPHGRYYGIEVGERSLIPDDDAKLGATRFEDWLIQAAKQAANVDRRTA